MTVIHMTGYQQGIFYALGCQQESRFALRCIDRRYLDEVAHLFDGCTVYYQKRTQGKKGCYCIKSARVSQISLDNVTDHAGFLRAVIELNGSIGLATRKQKVTGHHYYRPRLRIYGTEAIVDIALDHLPIIPKKMQHHHTNTGHTCEISINNLDELLSVYDYLSGYTVAPDFWQRYADYMNGKLNTADRPWSV